MATQTLPVTSQEKLDNILGRIDRLRGAGIEESLVLIQDVLESVVIELKIQRELINKHELLIQHEESLRTSKPLRSHDHPTTSKFKKGDRVSHKAPNSAEGTVEAVSNGRVQVSYGTTRKLKRWYKEDELVWTEKSEA